MIRLLGLLLVLVAAIPAWPLLRRAETGLAGEATVGMAAAGYADLWLATAVLALVAIVAGFAVAPAAVERVARRVARVLERPSPVAFALLAAALGAVLTLLVRHLIGEPGFIDAVAQSVHARYLAAGRLAGPLEVGAAASPGAADLAFWHVHNTLATGRGWVSQYPPGHVAVLAAGHLLGAASLVAPALFGLLVASTARLAEALLEEVAVARAGVLLVATSPFLLALAAAGMNHVTAAAFGVTALWLAGVRTSRGGAGDVAVALAAGVALGLCAATRPLTGVVFGLLVVARALLATPVSRLAAIALGTALPTALLLAWNARFFGAPLRFGYEAALGPDAGLGWGLDPWGNSYGLREAVAYTVTELQALGGWALETPLSIVALVGVGLLIASRIPVGEKLLIAWATLPVLAQTAYWHHGLWMGPRMLYEAAPAWILLAVVAAVRLLRRVPASSDGATRGSAEGFSPRAALAVGLAAALVAGFAYRAPGRIAEHAAGRDADRAVRLLADADTDGRGAIAFVHGSWADRLGARLAALGVRADSIEAALRQNPTCAVETYTRAREAGAPPPPLDMTPRATDLPRLVRIAGGSRVRVAEGEAPSPECTREARADRLGVIGMTALIDRGALPGLDDARPMFVRDLGPDRNAALIAALPDRTPLVLVGRLTQDELLLDVLPHERAMRELWGAAPQTTLRSP